MPEPPDQFGHALPQTWEVELPAGGRLHLQSIEEVELWEQSAQKYQEDYHLTAQNDLLLLGAILTQQLALFRAQQRLNGMEPELDRAGVPTGRYKRVAVKVGDMSAAQATITKASEQIIELEKTLGIDKKGREAGGQHTVASYVETLKKASREYGIHIAKRVKAYESVCMEARWKLRLLRNGDAEDRAYHDLTPEKFTVWLEGELEKLEELDRRFAADKGKLFVGKA